MKIKYTKQRELCCRNCSCRSEKSLYCQALGREISLDDYCRLLIYRPRHDLGLVVSQEREDNE